MIVDNMIAAAMMNVVHRVVGDRCKGPYHAVNAMAMTAITMPAQGKRNDCFGTVRQ